MSETKIILDACCGSRMFWFDKENPLALFADIRDEEYILCDGRNLKVHPDIVSDFTDQIDVIGPIEETELMKCKLYVDGRVCVIGMSLYDYEELMREKVFIRDGKSVDSAGVINTTNTFIEKD